jgi:DNA-binding protein HU-beta
MAINTRTQPEIQMGVVELERMPPKVGLAADARARFRLHGRAGETTNCSATTRFSFTDPGKSLQWRLGLNKTKDNMAKALTKSQITAALAEKVEITKKQSAQFLDELAALAYKNAKNSFTIPGLGKLVLVNRKARMGRNPATGETIKIAAKRVVKFRVAKAAKDAILGSK